MHGAQSGHVPRDIASILSPLIDSNQLTIKGKSQSFKDIRLENQSSYNKDLTRDFSFQSSNLNSSIDLFAYGPLPLDLLVCHKVRGLGFQIFRQSVKKSEKEVICISSDDDDEAPSKVFGSRSKRQRAAPMPETIAILTWNVWFNEDMMHDERMEAISEVIIDKTTTIIMLQEATVNIIELLRASPWFELYNVTIPTDDDSGCQYFVVLFTLKIQVTEVGTRWTRFDNSSMRRCIAFTQCLIFGQTLSIGTSHFEATFPSIKREQADMAISILKSLAGEGDIVFGGDLNWNEDRKEEADGPIMSQLQLSGGWRDLWPALRTDPGYTRDASTNQMLSSSGNGLKLRLDRFLARLDVNFEPLTIDLVGNVPIEGVTFMASTSSAPSTAIPLIIMDFFSISSSGHRD